MAQARIPAIFMGEGIGENYSILESPDIDENY